MSRDDDVRLRPGRIRNGSPPARRATRFVGEVMRAARKTGHTGKRFGGSSSGRSIGGRGRFAQTAKGFSRDTRRVIIKARVVRHSGARYRSVPLSQHIGYLQRDGVGQDGQRADLFGHDSDRFEGRTFTETWDQDRYHFRFIESPEDAHHLEDLRAFTRDLMVRAEFTIMISEACLLQTDRT